jgi:hypothetical protein
VRFTRSLAGGLLALATFGVGALAAPASALLPAEIDAFQEPVQTQPVETPEQQRAREDTETELRAAFGKAKVRATPTVAAPSSAPLSTPSQALDALAVLSNIEATYDLETETDDFAEIDPGTGNITFFKDFFDTGENSPLEQDRKLFSPPLSAEEWPAMVVLHEILHLFGKDHDDSDESVRQYEDALAKECFNSSKPKPPDPPPPPPGLGGGDFNDGAIGAPLYTVPEYVFVDPLPEGYGDVRVVVPDNPEIVPDEPQPIPDDFDPDDPCALDPIGCGDGYDSRMYDPYAFELMY